MRNIFNWVSTQKDRLLGLSVLGISALMVPTAAQAQGQGVGQVGRNISNNFTDLGNLLMNGALLGGVFFSGAGLMKLKAAADDGGQRVKYSEGLWRLGVGGSLTALPFVTSAMRGTVDGGMTGSTVSNSGGFIFR
jgi:hypothetical protein